MGQLAKKLADQNARSSFLENTQANPKEHCKTILTTSGRVVRSEVVDKAEIEEVVIEKELEEDIVVENNHEEELVKKEKLNKIKKGKEKVVTLPVQSLPYPHGPTKKGDGSH